MAGPLGLGPCVFQTLGLERSERNSLSSPLPAYPRAELSGSVCLSREPLSSLRVWGVTLRQVGSAQGDLVSTACSLVCPHSGPWRNLRLPFCFSEVVKTAAKPLCLDVPSV